MRRALHAAWMRAAWVCGLVIACTLGGALPASAAAPAPTPTGEPAVVYGGTIRTVATDSNRKKHNNPVKKVQFSVACTDGTCTFVQTEGVYYLTQLSWTAGQSKTAKHLAGSKSSCSSGKPPDGDLTLTIDAAAFTAVFTAPTPGWQDCNGTQTYRWAQVITFSGTYVSGPECILDVGGCPTPTPTPAAVTPTPIAVAVSDPDPAVASSSSFLDTGSPAAPSVLSTLAAPATAGTAPSQLLVAVVLTVVLVLLVAFPTSLLNSAVEAGTGRFSDWWSGRRARRSASTAAGGTPAPHASAPKTPWTKTWWWAAVGVAAASVVSSFVDPEFGFNAGSGRVVLSILVSFAIDVVIGWALVVLLMRRMLPEATHSYVFQPATLLVVVAAVAFTRVTGFEPGIVFGLVAGVAFGAIAGRAGEARAALVTLGYAFGVAVVAWVLYGLLVGTSGDSFWSTFVVETLSSIAVGGMAALPIALFPLRGLPGRALWAWNRWVWAGAYAIGLFAFFVVLMPMPFSWGGVHWNLGAWVGVYLAYAVFAVAAWLVLARPWRRDAEGEAEEAEDDAAAEAPASDPVSVSEGAARLEG